MRRWTLYIDTGGTFTDCLAADPQGKLHSLKVLSNGSLRATVTNVQKGRLTISPLPVPLPPVLHNYRIWHSTKKTVPSSIIRFDPSENSIYLQDSQHFTAGDAVTISAGESPVILAARLATGTGLEEAMPVEEIRVATTLGTNALLENKGADVCLICTEGFGDLPHIGDQSRPQLFALDIPPPRLFHHASIGVFERMDASGQAVAPLTTEEIRRVADEAISSGSEAFAVSLVNAWRNPSHEKAIVRALREKGCEFVSAGHEVAPGIHYLQRTASTVVNAYLSPKLDAFRSEIRQAMPDADIYFMQSGGGLIRDRHFRALDSMISGPAAGALGALWVGGRHRLDKVISFDMGGTSTDCSLMEGRIPLSERLGFEDFSMKMNAVEIDTVAAGGGSICKWTPKGIAVGPESAGAFPGPACYGNGGPFCLSDVALLSGRIHPYKANIPLSRAASQAAFKLFRESLPGEKDAEDRELIQLLTTLAVEHMAGSIERISLFRGHDPGEFSLVSFGGAGGMFACELAEYLGIKKIVLPVRSGILSAAGLRDAKLRTGYREQILKPFPASGEERMSLAEQWRDRALAYGQQRGLPLPEITEMLVSMRLSGQSSSIELDWKERIPGTADFRAEYENIYGYFPSEGQIELVSVNVILEHTARTPGEWQSGSSNLPKDSELPALQDLAGNVIPAYDWNYIKKGGHLSGPALICHEEASAFLSPGWRCTVAEEGDLVFERKMEPAASSPASHSVKDNRHERYTGSSTLAMASLFANRFTKIAEEMGAVLQRTAISPNIRERLDFSCAIMDSRARLLVNAPHIPVHLGSMGISLRLLLEDFPIGKGDLLVYNHPQYGGSHLPDITLVKAVYDDNGALIAYVANRAHHAEIGGISPGSMPAKARKLKEEGVIIRPFYLARKGKYDWEGLRKLFEEAEWPSRNTGENISDIEAAVASLQRGEKKIRMLQQQSGAVQFRKALQAIFEMSRKSIVQAIVEAEWREAEAREKLDNGAPIQVTVKVEGGQMKLDFSGSAGVQPSNFNANLSIVYSAVIYVLRLWVAKEIPLNDGLMENISLHVPEGMLHPDFSDDESAPATAAGNVEISQRLVDCLLKALGLAACSQGTMNNVLFGNGRFGYYETLGGGAGATARSDGRSGVHQHMTNTRITDIEEMEQRFPVRIREFGLRKGSGGRGKHSGGDGLVRRYEFLEPVTLTLLSQHRVEAPYGLQGGAAGKTGAQYIVRNDGRREELEGVDTAELNAGDAFVVETPGGGGWGSWQ